MTLFHLWDLPGDVLAAPESASGLDRCNLSLSLSAAACVQWGMSLHLPPCSQYALALFFNYWTPLLPSCWVLWTFAPAHVLARMPLYAHTSGGLPNLRVCVVQSRSCNCLLLRGV